MKAVVLAAGSGTRMRPIAYSMAKQLIPVANKPVLFCGLEDIAEAGILDTIVVVAPDTGAEIRSAVGDGSQFGLSVEYVVQPEPLGIAHALGITRSSVGDDDILLYLGDSMMKCGVREIVDSFHEGRPNCHILLSRVENPERFGVVTLDSAGAVAELVEKPADPQSDLALAGVYLFDSSVWAAIDALEPSARGEYEITEAIQYLLDTGNTVAVTEVEGWWKDTGRKEDLLEANDLVLAEVRSEIAGTVASSDVRGELILGPGSSLTNCRVNGPVIVGADTVIADSTLGPATSIGDGCALDGATVVRSVVLDGARIERWRIEASLLGREVSMSGSGPATPVSVILGERSEVVG